jgi:hypothetical protein
MRKSYKALCSSYVKIINKCYVVIRCDFNPFDVDKRLPMIERCKQDIVHVDLEIQELLIYKLTNSYSQPRCRWGFMITNLHCAHNYLIFTVQYINSKHKNL